MMKPAIRPKPVLSQGLAIQTVAPMANANKTRSTATSNKASAVLRSEIGSSHERMTLRCGIGVSGGMETEAESWVSGIGMGNGQDGYPCDERRTSTRCAGSAHWPEDD